ncbi:TetR/AcrR family transcriptional regulator [Paramicrobacterium fandaimingii]|uniref:TetR/AcrR family transcriptional regulator n=1 Tax=Paramicrobacterium fandaimingii TaxID=2708079 RepID=UPI00141EE812|nr:TetR/AcrR family transcriptional regulator [Microbacterium fandaimingii]
MPRSGAGARARLAQAALELYGARGYDQTTTAEIASRAGLSERTYFRHFADKREVLYHVEAEREESLRRALAKAPVDLTPIAAVLHAFRATAPDLEASRAFAQTRHRIIVATPALRERELAKAASLSAIVADALRERGLPERRANLLAQVTTATLGHAIHTWIADPSSNLDTQIVDAFADLHAFAGLGSAS